MQARDEILVCGDVDWNSGQFVCCLYDKREGDV